MGCFLYTRIVIKYYWSYNQARTLTTKDSQWFCCTHRSETYADIIREASSPRNLCRDPHSNITWSLGYQVEEGREDCRSQRNRRKAVKCCPPDMTWPLYTRAMKYLTRKHKDLSSIPINHIKKPGMMAHNCIPRAREVETVDSWSSLARKASLSGKL